MIRYDYDPLANQLRLPGYIPSSCGVQVYSGLSCGLAMSCLTTIFLPVSGAHINPAVSVSAATIQVSCRQYSPLIGRTALNTDL